VNTLNLESACKIIDAALAHAEQQGFKPLTVTVLDAGGHTIALKRQNRSGILRPDIAHGKAWGALGMGVGSRAFVSRAETAPAFFVALANASHGRLFPVPGGVLIRDAHGDIVGAVGISGDLPDHDEACAVYGIEQAGLRADPGQAAAH